MAAFRPSNVALTICPKTPRSAPAPPQGHPEGYLEAFANLYAGFAEAIRARAEGREPGVLGQNLSLTYDGLKGVAFVEAVVDSHEAADQPWIRPVAV